jgi:hypothetical protein
MFYLLIVCGLLSRIHDSLVACFWMLIMMTGYSVLSAYCRLSGRYHFTPSPLQSTCICSWVSLCSWHDVFYLRCLSAMWCCFLAYSCVLMACYLEWIFCLNCSRWPAVCLRNSICAQNPACPRDIVCSKWSGSFMLVVCCLFRCLDTQNCVI